MALILFIVLITNFEITRVRLTTIENNVYATSFWIWILPNEFSVAARAA